MTKLNRIEQQALSGFEGGVAHQATGDTVEDATMFALRACLEAGRLIRPARLIISAQQEHRKDDGSPATALELEIEEVCRELLVDALPGARLIGEESGGDWSDSGVVATIDPIDGTWAFLSGTESFSTALTVFNDGQAVVAVIANPVTGEIGYATGMGPARLIQLGSFGVPNVATTLPLTASDPSKTLVNLHPSRAGAPIADALYKLWNTGSVQMLRSPGGSPSWALLEAARGSFTYVNLWSSRPAEPWDLAAGNLILAQAGGAIVDVDNQPINALTHSGPFIASVSQACRSMVAAQVREAALRHK